MALIVIGMVIFALSHSLTADPKLKYWVQQQMGERAYQGWYRLLYNLVSVITLAPIMVVIWRTGSIIYAVPADMALLFTVCQFIGSIGLVISLLQIDLLRFAGLAQVIAYFRGESLPLPPEKLQTGGLYRLVRHPLYFFSLLSIWFISPMTDTMLVFNIAATLYFVFGSLIEERRMLRYFGDEYRDYQARVAWLIPLLRLK